MAFVAVRSKVVFPVVVDSLLIVTPHFGDSVIVLCFVLSYFASILVLQPSRWGER